MPRHDRTRRVEIDPNQIEVTMEYDVSQRISGNRAVSEAHVKNIMAKIREHDMKTPIQIDQNFGVIDGQHTLEARKRLELPVYYYWIEDAGLKQVQTINSTRKAWSNDDYTNSYIELGNKHYEIYKWFRGKYGLPHAPTCMLLSGGDDHKLRQRFQGGEFTVTNLAQGKERAEMVLQIQPYFSHWKDAGFIKAFLIALNREGFDFKVFMHRLEQNPTMLRPAPTIDAYLLQLEELYNYKARNRVPLRYGHDIQATSRAAA